MFTPECESSQSKPLAGSSGGELPSSFHAANVMQRGAALKGAALMENLFDEESADLMNTLFEEDFKLFQYPLWNGRNRFHLRPNS